MCSFFHAQGGCRDGIHCRFAHLALPAYAKVGGKGNKEGKGTSGKAQESNRGDIEGITPRSEPDRSASKGKGEVEPTRVTLKPQQPSIPPPQELKLPTGDSEESDEENHPKRKEGSASSSSIEPTPAELAFLEKMKETKEFPEIMKVPSRIQRRYVEMLVDAKLARIGEHTEATLKRNHKMITNYTEARLKSALGSITAFTKTELTDLKTKLFLPPGYSVGNALPDNIADMARQMARQEGNRGKPKSMREMFREQQRGYAHQTPVKDLARLFSQPTHRRPAPLAYQDQLQVSLWYQRQSPAPSTLPGYQSRQRQFLQQRSMEERVLASLRQPLL